MAEEVEQSQQGTQLDSNPQRSESVTFPTKVDEDAQTAAERTAFKTYVDSSNEAIPDNFKDADSWFTSLKEAQSNYTKGQQEMAELRQQAADNFDNQPQETAPAAPVEPEITPDTPELRIPDQVQEEVKQAAENIGVTQETYEAWAVEMAQTGTLGETTRNDIKSMTGFSDNMIDDYMAGQKARLKENFSKASTVVGGKEKLTQIFDWAGKTLSPEVQQQINMGLASPSYEVTLRGLSSLYEESVKNAKAAEPVQNERLTNMPASETGIRAYATKREFKEQRNDPKFKMEPRYRQMVEARMSMTDWNHLPQQRLSRTSRGYHLS